ncbi:hypothetical protein JCM4814A_00820 [Streptomyces phaeofaciens JCM 4814]|uniref:Uncharacterized protein n=1 Tax=Streptomyces phaeofaciens TaxID=68254 RepID=A0A918HQB1_9ACTN|nr:hypothetical protein [Streptomyces phaeofaciens]GGT92186.1 hypothetical protein GCM10010226_82760 [Streptomyces phaeofaciens]
MTVNDVLAGLVVITALRVFLPDLRTGVRSMLRAGAQIGVAELLRHQPARAEAVQPHSATSRDVEA